jgi:hypothetical protein
VNNPHFRPKYAHVSGMHGIGIVVVLNGGLDVVVTGVEPQSGGSGWTLDLHDFIEVRPSGAREVSSSPTTSQRSRSL